MNYLNYTPHAIVLNDGTVFPPSGTIARVSSSFTDFDSDGVCQVVYGDVQNLPDPQDGVKLIVSAMILAAAKGRQDLVASATGHPDCIRDSAGHIVSVPGFVH